MNGSHNSLSLYGITKVTWSIHRRKTDVNMAFFQNDLKMKLASVIPNILNKTTPDSSIISNKKSLKKQKIKLIKMKKTKNE